MQRANFIQYLLLGSLLILGILLATTRSGPVNAEPEQRPMRPRSPGASGEQQPVSANFVLRLWSFAAAAGEQRSTSFSLHSTLGEPAAATPLTSAHYRLFGGYEAMIVRTAAATATPVAANPTPTLTPTSSDDPTAVPVPAPPTGTPAPAATCGDGQTRANNRCANYLPLVIKREPPPPTATAQPAWRQLVGNGLTVAALAIQGETLFIGASGNSGSDRGLYRATLTNCPNPPALTRVSAINRPGGESIYSITFAGSKGLVASYDAGIYRSTDGGQHWAPAATALVRPRSVVNVNAIFFAGTEDQGVYQSNDHGERWSLLSNRPTDITVTRLDEQSPMILWIGTAGEGVYWLNTELGRLVQNKNGLNNAALNVWDFAFDQTQIYVAGDGGVFVGNGSSDWAPYGPSPSGVQFRSLAVTGVTLYAGANSNGVWQRPLTGGDWVRITAAGWDESYTVRDLLYDGAHCGGLLAATNNGVWLYTQP
ncbi:MAG: hypothetical protein DYG89_23520 [Caldilinea sp. CFX5]|nr:hypothetical protein [Caldilinea sp. CFX5]